MAHIRRVAPDVPVILDAKRGDIGSTAEQYAREAFERYQADAVTLSPFLGFDSIEPYMQVRRQGPDPAVPHLQPRRRRPAVAAPGRAATCCTNTSRAWRRHEWNHNGQLGLVVGATFPAEIARVRELAPTLPLLLPGVGAQGGDAQACVQAGWRGDARHTHAPIIVNNGRSVLYASRGNEFAAAARKVADETRALLNSARRLQLTGAR